jgi:hypothetical protein
MKKFMGGRDQVKDLTEAQMSVAGRKAGEALRNTNLDAPYRKMPKRMVSQAWLRKHTKQNQG